MKNIFILLLLGCLSFQVKAQDADRVLTETAFRNLILGAASDSFEMVIALPKNVYNNVEGSSRRWVETLDLTLEEDKTYYDYVVARVRDMVSDPNYTIAAYAKEKLGKRDWYTIRVEYVSEGEAKKVFFSFFKVGDKMILADIG